MELVSVLRFVGGSGIVCLKKEGGGGGGGGGGVMVGFGGNGIAG